LVPRLKPKHEIDGEDVETEADKEELRKKALIVNEILTKEMEDRGLDSSSEEESDDEKKWDC
jgi:hypothetical protein